MSLATHFNVLMPLSMIVMTDRQSERERERETEGERDRQTGRQTERQRERGRQTERRTDRRTDGLTQRAGRCLSACLSEVMEDDVNDVIFCLWPNWCRVNRSEGGRTWWLSHVEPDDLINTYIILYCCF